MIFIFCMSHQPADISSEQSGGVIEFVAKIFVKDFENLSIEQKQIIIDNYQHFVRKLAHFLVYTSLAFLLSGFFHSFEVLKKASGYIISFLVAFIFSCSDEIHQYFISGRSCQISDVLLDSGGMFFGILIFILFTLIFVGNRGASSSEKI